MVYVDYLKLYIGNFVFENWIKNLENILNIFEIEYLENINENFFI